MILSNILYDPKTLNAVQGNHDAMLVVVSWLVALAASYAGLDIIKLVSKFSHSAWRSLWLLAGASAMGLGVWSMHFIGMHAYRLDFPISHAPVATLLSIIPAILGSLIAMVVLSRETLPHRAMLLAGCSLGAGIGMMHYSGMAAMQMPAELYHALDLFLVSLLVAVGLGIVSVYAYRVCQQEWGVQRSRSCAFIAALCVSVAVCGMHYVAMQAAWFVPDANILAHPAHHHSHWLIKFIAGVAVLTALLTLLATKVQRRLHDSERHEHMTQTRLLEVIAAIQDGVILLDSQSRIRLCNAAFEQLMGMKNAQLIDKPIAQIPYATDSKNLTKHIRESLTTQGTWSGMITALRANGQRFPAWLSVNRVAYAGSVDSDYVALLSDRSEEQLAQEHIRYMAYHDMLTELPNRRALQEHLVQLGKAKSVTQPLALLALFDIDRFKVLNDSLGQDIGDELLRQLGKRLQQFGGHSERYVARLDGNEFALVGILSSNTHPNAEQEAKQLIDEIQRSLTADYQLQGHTYPCQLNVGLLIFNPHAKAPITQLLKRTDLALLEAKRQRDGKLQFFCLEQERELEERLTLERELSHAIAHNELSLYLQTQVNTERSVIGAEALIRWIHPEKGLISPGRFIPLAENTGLILPLGDWVLQEGCRLLGEWHKDPDLRHLKLSLNVSVRQFKQPDFTEQVIAAIEKHAVPPKRLTLELTESLLLSDPGGTIEKMTRLRQLGISFALDDFGTGYSSLAYLKLLPLDTLKIDIAFVKDLTLDMQATPIAATIITLAESLRLKVVAEGVETEEQQQVLAKLGCNTYQGFLFGKPVPADLFHQSMTTSF